MCLFRRVWCRDPSSDIRCVKHRRVAWLSSVWCARAPLALMFLWLGVIGGSRVFALPPEAIQLNNVGKAHLENRETADAVARFEEVTRLVPDAAAAWRNLARAQMLPRRQKEHAEALVALAEAAKLDPDSAATAYLTGLVHLRESRFKEAIPPLERAVRLDPNTAALRCQLAMAYQPAGQLDKAREQLEETVRLDPLHSNAIFKLGMFARKAGDRKRYAELQREYLRLRQIFDDSTRTPEALERCRYTQAELLVDARSTEMPAIEVTFQPASAAGFDEASVRALAVLNVNAQGRYALVGLTGEGVVTVWEPEANGGYVPRKATTEKALALGGEPVRAIVGNWLDEKVEGQRFDPTTDALNDVLFTAPSAVSLMLQTPVRSFQDATSTAGMEANVGGPACWFDAEHDGDLDLAMAGKDGGLLVMQNNGDGTFREVSKRLGLVLPADASPLTDIVAVDLDRNVAGDLIVATQEHTYVFMNQRTGRYALVSDPPGPFPGAKQVLADDVDQDGRPDTVFVQEDRVVVRSSADPRIQTLSATNARIHSGAFVDFDNDGFLDIAVAAASAKATRLLVWRNEGGRFAEATARVGLDEWRHDAAVRDLLIFDHDGDGDTDMLLCDVNGRVVVLRNEGGHAHRQLKVRLVGGKTNAMGLGTHLEVRRGQFFASREVQQLPIEIGVGPRDTLDAVQTIWTNGIIDNEVNVAVGNATLTIAEKNVAAGSCPYLYAWDGRKMRFVTDLLGNAPLGLSLTREFILPADPDEIVYVGSSENVQPRGDAYELVVTEELREVGYFDEAKLIVVDHPVEVEVHPTDKLMPPPFPATELWSLHRRRVATSVVGDDGQDRRKALAAIDGHYAPAGEPLPPPLRGMCRPLTLTMDFGAIDPAAENVLALTGWIQYGDASTNIAMSQNAGLTVVPPRLEAESASRGWVAVDAVVGMPAGKTKTILVDLAGKLPDDVRRLRLSTTFHLTWDRIALFERYRGEDMREVRVSPAQARLGWHGYGEIKARGERHPQTPDFDRVSELPPWRTTPQGWCTQYGDVRELIDTRDERIAILNGGDAMTLRFPRHALPSRIDGQQRSFYFYSVGWDKDADPNVVDGDQVLPLPVDMPEEDRLLYNTRFVPRDVRMRWISQ